ncbi:putative tricarboxylic transport membrane protein [Azomonas agilis]|uniref:Putative tricarboxylic transport membrane protein n=1 Tax=Azomonas agilis TaxID=116849 RepID=A0A562I2C3_9GAMM|nr:tripartite tricarboxylate transporter permease [Azomonas agilis]TWH64803.1 putative tricarboxylic transport membrane protein [Azomonas agilis]
MMDVFAQAFINVIQPASLGLMFLGVGVGIIFGSIPGLSAAMAIALFLPMTFSMGPEAGMTLLVSLYIGAISGGLISAILLNIPGTPSSISTCFDGAPMAARGEAAKALGLGIVFSFLGGLLSFIALIFIAPPLAQLTLKFSPIEYFAVSIFALTMIAALSSGSMIKGLLSGMLGLMFSTVGLAPIDGSARFTLSIDSLSSGFDLLAVLIGLFAVTEVLQGVERTLSDGNAKVIALQKIRGFGFSMAEFLAQKWNLLRSSLIGIFIGILPGIGGSTSGILAYIAAKKQSKHPEKFGTGIPDGIVASETANNATIGGALVPLLALGIPGDGVTAMMLGGFMIHGLTPGPLLFKTNADFVYGIFAACLVANVIMLMLEFFGLRIYVKLLKIPKYLLMPVIIVLCTVGAFSVNSQVFNVWCILLFGVIGYLMVKGGLPIAPAILGFILGPLVETNLRRGLMLTEGNFLGFLERPIALTFLVVAVLALVVPLFSAYTQHRRSTALKPA